MRPLPEAFNAILPLTAAARFGGCEVVPARSGMGVDDPEGGRLVAQMNEDAGEHGVLVHVGKISGVKGVLVVHEFRWCMILSDHALAPAHWRHDDLVAPARALGHFRTIVEFQILR